MIFNLPLGKIQDYIIFDYGDVSTGKTKVIGSCGLSGSTSDTSAAVFNLDYSHGNWRVAYMKNINGGNHKLWTSNPISLAGYKKICITLRCDDPNIPIYYAYFGAASTQANFSGDSWIARATIAGSGGATISTFTTYECAISSSETAYVALRMTGMGSAVRITNWWLEG